MNTVEKIKEIVAESLYIEKETIQLNSNLMLDLGAESIDFLDIIFRLEKTFSIKIPRGEIEKETKQDLTDEEFGVGGVIQAKGLERLALVMPEVDTNLIKQGLKVRDIPTLYTIATFVRLVESHVARATAQEGNANTVSYAVESVANG